jgi:hypothetical protein
MHEHIPNSQVIWYDSISATDGVIRYQNALNSVNKEFYMLTDGIFTNYWWNEELLKTSISNKERNNIYIGNDCFGRNTYGGGKYDIYKAANKILEYKKDLQIALFAPGFTYQDNAENNRILYHLNELSMYKGMKTQTIIIDKWRDIINRGNGWGQEGDWAVTSYEICERSAYFKFQPLEPNTKVKVQFMYNIKGTAPLN